MLQKTHSESDQAGTLPMEIYVPMSMGLFEQLSVGWELVVLGPGWLMARCGGPGPTACPVPSLVPCAGSPLWLLPLLGPTAYPSLPSGPQGAGRESPCTC